MNTNIRYIQSVEGFFRFCEKYHVEVKSMHVGNSIYYLGFFAGRVVAQYVEYVPHPGKVKN